MQFQLDLFFATSCFLFGAVVGSFLNVVILRIPVGESIVEPPSRCPHCGNPVRPWDNIPVLSFVLLRGKCRDCGSPISLRYPFIEALTGGLAAALYFRFGLTPAFGVLFIFCAAMIAVFWIDLDHMIIPNEISLNGLAIGIIASCIGWIPGMTWVSSIAGAVLGAAILYFPAVIYERVRGIEGLGRGDIKLLAAIGAFTGPAGVIFVLFMASVAGCLAAVIGMAFKGTRSGGPIPFGPFLTAAALLFVFAGADIIDAFFGFSHWFWSALGIIALLVDSWGFA